MGWSENIARGSLKCMCSNYSNRLQIPLATNCLMATLLSGLEIILYMGNRLKVYYEFLTRLPDCLARTNFEATLLELQVKLLQFLAKAMILYLTNPFVRSWKAIW